MKGRLNLITQERRRHGRPASPSKRIRAVEPPTTAAHTRVKFKWRQSLHISAKLISICWKGGDPPRQTARGPARGVICMTLYCDLFRRHQLLGDHLPPSLQGDFSSPSILCLRKATIYLIKEIKWSATLPLPLTLFSQSIQK